MRAIRIAKHSSNNALFATIDRTDRIHDTTVRYKSAFAVHPIRKWAGLAWRLQNLRVKVYAPAENMVTACANPGWLRVSQFQSKHFRPNAPGPRTISLNRLF